MYDLNLCDVSVLDKFLTGDYVIKNNRVYKKSSNQYAVLFSPGYGAGWSTWGANVFCPLAALIKLSGESFSRESYEKLANVFYGSKGGYYGAWDDLKICWLIDGEQFRIEEYDGDERIVLNWDSSWLS